ncbi:hypothetical protein FNF28_01901 [Cafeteria roenbergensis]|uniref:C2H2-type domain-containing protein n=1 Tax=Cafeteria roenbergensis TaxID=33653 RepID=A0A5A8DWB8_CAFRO|nr:hypothetical protein FNF28_01901 [Cafeteria roenbergensis]
MAAAAASGASLGLSASLDVMVRSLEDIDRLELGIQQAIDERPTSHWGALQTDSRIAAALSRIEEKSKAVLGMYADSDGLRAEEIKAMRGGDAGIMDTAALLAAFDARAAESAEYFATHPGATEISEAPAAALADLPTGVSFSGPEVLGRFLDVTPIEAAWAGVKGATKLSALSLCDALVSFRDRIAGPLGEGRLDSSSYRRFLATAASHLCSFYDRTHPLAPSSTILADAFARRRAACAGQPGPAGEGAAAPGASQAAPAVDLEAAASAADLEALGLDALKEELMRRGLKCGGNLRARAQRLWSVRGLAPDAIPNKLKAKAAVAAAIAAPATAEGADSRSAGAGAGAGAQTPSAGAAVGSAAEGPGQLGSGGGGSGELAAVPFASTFPPGGMRAAWLEDVVEVLCDALRITIRTTRQRLERRETLTPEEREADLEEELAQAKGADAADEGDESDSDDDPVASSKAKLKRNVVLGPDGEPISHWLYRLHGLDRSFSCEICGQTLWGPRNFEWHFNGSEHAAAMKALGIPNSRHFFGVTHIEDAKRLWARLEAQLKEDKAKTGEQFEDSAGNVLDKRTYEDLASQNLL